MVLELLFEYGEHESSSVAQILNVVHELGLPRILSSTVFSIGFILSSVWYRARFNLHSANER